MAEPCFELEDEGMFEHFSDKDGNLIFTLTDKGRRVWFNLCRQPVRFQLRMFWKCTAELLTQLRMTFLFFETAHPPTRRTLAEPRRARGTTQLLLNALFKRKDLA